MLRLNTSKHLPLLNQSIQNVHKLLQIGDITPVDLYNACLERIYQTKILNAFITVTEDCVLKQAQQSKQRYDNSMVFFC